MPQSVHEGRFIDDEVAATHMVRQIPRVLADATVEDVFKLLRGQVYECADTIFVVDPDDRLIGVVRINDLFSNSQRLIHEIMEPEHDAVGLTADQEDIASLAIRVGMIAVPVVDEDQKLVGAVPPESLFRILSKVFPYVSCFWLAAVFDLLSFFKASKPMITSSNSVVISD